MRFFIEAIALTSLGLAMTLSACSGDKDDSGEEVEEYDSAVSDSGEETGLVEEPAEEPVDTGSEPQDTGSEPQDTASSEDTGE
jgi:hypothetical protein